MTERTVPVKTVIWQGLWWPGAEWCGLASAGAGWQLAGTAIVSVEGKPTEVRYQLTLDESWATRDARIARQTALHGEQHIHLTVSQDQVWRIQQSSPAGQHGEMAELEIARGLVDIDLGFSPATNTLPIRRLAPAIGEAVDMTAVWLRFPELTIEQLPQRYTRLDERCYRYESGGGAFVAELEVDDLGLVVTYEGGWQRIAESSLTPQPRLPPKPPSTEGGVSHCDRRGER